ncbi:terpene synthase family protein [Aspergillus tanneri]|uniref:Terpene cyclase n=1 Tax=Aspergillus tanneri TaxID=1220188 RepID=A0A5M9ME20_9EURO|nr:terpene cyclase [Aspergillus tanneri]KAA8643986.1 terpene cyclase [Aspergillus tanneri]
MQATQGNVLRPKEPDLSNHYGYGHLTSVLAEARRVRFFDPLREPLETAIGRGVAALESIGPHSSNCFWIEKVSYSSPLLAGSYRLAALKAASSPVGVVAGSELWENVSPTRLDKHVKLFHLAPLFSSLPEWELRSSMIEAALFHPLLRSHRLDIFFRKDVKEDKYFDVIPFFWTSCNNRIRTYASTSFLYEMMLIALLNFQVDEFIEAVAGPSFQGRMPELRQLIHDLLPEEDAMQRNNSEANGHKDPKHPSYDEVFHVLSRFLDYVLNHPEIQSASVWDRRILKRELRTYLLAHATQAEDSTRFERRASQVSTFTSTKTNTFFNWVRTISADHISCPYAFAFVSCLLGASLTSRGGGGDCFPTIGEKYLSAAVCRHLSTMCRMYNDLGSAERDQDEGNLNSIDFPEFGVCGDVTTKKRALFELAEYERHCLVEALSQLNRHQRAGAKQNRDIEAARLGERRMEIWSMFCEEVDLYGQVYVVLGISSRMVPNGGGH